MRLGANRDALWAGYAAVFQFQLGAIGRASATVQLNDLVMFQFQLGAIGSKMSYADQKRNAIVSIPAWCDWEFPILITQVGLQLFQFQLGAIGSPMVLIIKSHF